MFLINQKGVFDMQYKQENEIRVLFDAGVLRKAEVMREPMGKGWIIIFIGADDQYAMRSQRDSIARSFKTIDAIEKKLSNIGFRKFTVNI